MPSAQHPAASTPGRVLRLLVAEDEIINQIVLGERLAQLGHSFVTVTNGRDALEALKGSEWDALLLDCHMPVMDGFETVATLRRLESDGAARTWVVAVTASAIEGEREACLRAGMDDFLLKPCEIGQLAQVIARIPARGQGVAPPAVDAALLTGLSTAKSRSGENLLNRMVALFIESGPVMLDQLDKGVREGDFAGAVAAAHKLAGGCSYFGADKLYVLCMEFEQLGRDNDHAAMHPLAPRIRQEYARVEQALKEHRLSG